MDARVAATAAETKRDILSIVRAARCNLEPRAMNQLVRAAALISTREDRSSFLQSVVNQAKLSSDRTLNEKAALEAISALIPSLQAAGAVLPSDIPTLQALAIGIPATTTAAGPQTQLQQQNAHRALALAAQANFRVVQIEDMPVIAVDEATCASFRVGPAPRASDIRSIAEAAERQRLNQSGGSGGTSTHQMIAASLAGVTSTTSALEASLTRRADPSARTRAARTRLAVATARVLRCPRFTANSLLGGHVSGVRATTAAAAAAAADGATTSASGGSGPTVKYTVHRISALDGLRLGHPVTLVGMFRYAPWLVPSALVAQHQQQLAQFGAVTAGTIGWILEDFTGTLPVVLPAAGDQQYLLSNGLIGDGAAVVVQGTWGGTSIRANHISLPPGETRQHTQNTVGATEDYFGLRPSDMHAASRSFNDASANVAILVSDVKISDRGKAQKLIRLLKEFEDRSSEMDLSKATFILVGDFVGDASSAPDSNSSGGGGAAAGNSNSYHACAALDASFNSHDRTTLNIAEEIDSLGRDLIQRADAATPATILTQVMREFATSLASACPQLAAVAEFILIPGPNDCCGSAPGVYPRAPLHTPAVLAFREKCPRTHAAPNPCRLRFLTQEYVLCRAPLHRSFAGRALPTIQGKTTKQQFQQNQQQKKAAAVQQQHKTEDADAAADPDQRQPFVDLAEVIVRGNFWFPIPSSGVLPAITTTAATATTTNTGKDAAANTNNQHPQQAHQPTVLRSWGGVRWALDRALYHGGAPHPPHVSLMCDDTSCWSCTVDEVMCANPGSFSQTGIFAWISPLERTVEFNELPN